MITISIGGMTVSAEKAGEGWLNQMIIDARKRGVPLCVQVNIDVPTAQLSLSTPGCGRTGGGVRPPTATESRIIEEWNRRGLNQPEIHPGELRAFLSDLGRLA
jgi:hypothetical protein